MLTEDERELVIDESLTFVVMEYRSEISFGREAEEVFWTAARLRVSRALEGRNATVRGGFERTSDEALDRLGDQTEDPAELVEQSLELAYVAEFAASLDDLEGQVLRVKWMSEHSALGYRKVAERLAIAPARARAAERSIATKLERFATLCAGGRLCAERSEAIVDLATGISGNAQAVRAAKAHIKHCSVCKTDYVMHLRAVRSAAFQRQVASVIPAAPLAESARRHGGPLRDLFADWLGRGGGHEAVPVVSDAAASGVGRGAGGVLAVKVLAVIAGGAATIGAATGILGGADGRSVPKPQAAASPTPSATASPRNTPVPRPTPSASPHHKSARKSSSRTQGGSKPSSHEQAPASAAPADSQADGASEFTPDSSNLSPAAPAPVPAAPGSSEFP